jgi:glycosyltransferase involved in cell wall biosynthesis
MPLTAAFAVPGSLETMTGGYFYDRRLVESLRLSGHDIRVITLPEGFPDPGPEAMAIALSQLQALPADQPVIVDGLAFGAMPTEEVALIVAPIIALVHHPLALETGLDPDLAARLRAREQANLRLARQVIAPSPHTKAVLVSEYGVPEGKVTVLLPGVDRVRPGATEQAKPPLILSVGILHPRKGHDVLLRALARLADLDWSLAIAGDATRDPVHADGLRALAAELGIAQRVRFLGALPDAALEAEYARADLFALATRYEG